MLNSLKTTDPKPPNPFKPGLTVDPRYFAGRKAQIDSFREYLRHTSAGNPQNVAVMGERGIGKSSLLRKFEAIAKDSGSMVVRRDLDPTVRSIEALVAFLLEAIRHEGTSYFSRKGRAEMKIREFFEKYAVSPSLQTPAGGGGITVARQALPPTQE